MIALLFDQGLPLRAAGDLRQAGHDVIHVSERGLQGATDAELLALARTEERVVVTLDSDFSMLLATSGAESPSVIHLRLQRVSRNRAVELTRLLIGRLSDRLRNGCIASVTPGRIRIRKLPLLSPSA